MEVITGVWREKLSYEQNAEGKYDIMITHDKKKYRTGFIFDSIKLLNNAHLRVCQTDSKGNKKYGLIAIHSTEIFLSCIFDKIKPYKGDVLQAYIGDEEYLINCFGQVYSREFWDMRNP